MPPQPAAMRPKSDQKIATLVWSSARSRAQQRLSKFPVYTCNSIADVSIIPMIEDILAFTLSLRATDWFAAVSAAIAAVSFLLNRSTVKRQQAMQVEAFRAERDRSLIAWANAAIAGIADAQRLCRDLKNGLVDPASERPAVSELRTRLSVLLDSGRLFFPNQPPLNEDAPSQSEAAYAGQSHQAIDALYKVYRVISDLRRPGGLEPAEAVPAIVAERRRFVSTVFQSIDPRRREAAFVKLTAAD